MQMQFRHVLIPLLLTAVLSASPALAQDKGAVNPKPLPPLANPNDPKLGAKELFARRYLPAAADKPRMEPANTLKILKGMTRNAGTGFSENHARTKRAGRS